MLRRKDEIRAKAGFRSIHESTQAVRLDDALVV
jgi:hypothetical protein